MINSGSVYLGTLYCTMYCITNSIVWAGILQNMRTLNGGYRIDTLF